MLLLEVKIIATATEWFREKRSAKNILPTLFQCFYLLAMLFLVASTAFANNGYVTLYGAAALGLFLFIGCFCKKMLDKMPSRQFFILLSILLACFWGLNFFVANSIQYQLPPDTDIIYKSAADLLDDGRLNNINNDLSFYYTEMTLYTNADYFCMFPNNIAHLLTLCFVFLLGRPFGIQPLTPAGLTWAVFISSLFIALCALFVCLIVKRLFHSHSATLLAFLLCAVCPTFYYSVPNFYTDTYVLLPMLAASYAFLVFIDKGLLRYAFAGTLLFTWASLVKITAVIALLAVVLYYVFTPKKASPFKKPLVIFGLAATLLLLRFLFSFWYINSAMFDFSRADELTMPLSLWFCFGSSGLGTINNPDRLYAISITDPGLRSRLLWERAFHNYRQYSVADLLTLWHRKLVWTWNDGLYEGGIYAQWPLHTNWSTAITQPDSRAYFFVYWFSQGHMMMLYLASLLSGLVSFAKKKVDSSFFFHLCIFGIMLYLQIFETAPRRAILALPFLFFNLIYLHHSACSPSFVQRLRTGIARFLPASQKKNASQ